VENSRVGERWNQNADTNRDHRLGRRGGDPPVIGGMVRKKGRGTCWIRTKENGERKTLLKKFRRGGVRGRAARELGGKKTVKRKMGKTAGPSLPTGAKKNWGGISGSKGPQQKGWGKKETIPRSHIPKKKGGKNVYKRAAGGKRTS